MENIETKMRLDESKDCKTVFRFKSNMPDDQPPFILYLYVKKYAFPNAKPPQEILVTIDKLA